MKTNEHQGLNTKMIKLNVKRAFLKSERHLHSGKSTDEKEKHEIKWNLDFVKRPLIRAT